MGWITVPGNDLNDPRVKNLKRFLEVSFQDSFKKMQ